ncbi:uncharacterized protein PgNI_08010 [Pyricularia grisea]|uniref:Uncharacterized protein n=1 Tax=Pyricularia grisea TaxID=148305 RepID=A0A6P8AWJ1_PYRGI|nr:uncharacterized protein PgNI_08010 [Pyricularia grisea]TLD06601.1 hypothetical protein PgNI_08010 [Pyricularia grisea]
MRGVKGNPSAAGFINGQHGDENPGGLFKADGNQNVGSQGRESGDEVVRQTVGRLIELSVGEASVPGRDGGRVGSELDLLDEQVVDALLNELGRRCIIPGLKLRQVVGGNGIRNLCLLQQTSVVSNSNLDLIALTQVSLEDQGVGEEAASVRHGEIGTRLNVEHGLALLLGRQARREFPVRLARWHCRDPAERHEKRGDHVVRQSLSQCRNEPGQTLAHCFVDAQGVRGLCFLGGVVVVKQVRVGLKCEEGGQDCTVRIVRHRNHIRDDAVDTAFSGFVSGLAVNAWGMSATLAVDNSTRCSTSASKHIALVEGPTRRTRAPAWEMMVCRRAAGWEGSSGTNAAPAFIIETMAMMAQADFSMQKGTSDSGPTPREVKWAAILLDISSTCE